MRFCHPITMAETFLQFPLSRIRAVSLHTWVCPFCVGLDLDTGGLPFSVLVLCKIIRLTFGFMKDMNLQFLLSHVNELVDFSTSLHQRLVKMLQCCLQVI